MKIGILETGLVRDQLADRFDPYPVMFQRLLDLAGHELQYESFCVVQDEMPTSINQCDGWLITGSRHGAYESHTWIPKLEVFIRSLAESKVPLAGICFGHQIIAQALGGSVVKSEKGWGVGLHQYRVDQAPAWMEGQPQQVGMYVFHQDQVLDKPESAEVFASSEFCPYAGLVYGDPIISMQGHPEFDRAYMEALLDIYGGSLLSAEVLATARDSLSDGQTADTLMLATWIVKFFITHQKVKAVATA